MVDPEKRKAWELYLRAAARWEPTCEASALLDLLDRSIELHPDFVPAWRMARQLKLRQGRQRLAVGIRDEVSLLSSFTTQTLNLGDDSG